MTRSRMIDSECKHARKLKQRAREKRKRALQRLKLSAEFCRIIKEVFAIPHVPDIGFDFNRFKRQ